VDDDRRGLIANGNSWTSTSIPNVTHVIGDRESTPCERYRVADVPGIHRADFDKNSLQA
jgi:hypothetical protein